MILGKTISGATVLATGFTGLFGKRSEALRLAVKPEPPSIGRIDWAGNSAAGRINNRSLPKDVTS
jgi:hypothetical protein